MLDKRHCLVISGDPECINGCVVSFNAQLRPTLDGVQREVRGMHEVLRAWCHLQRRSTRGDALFHQDPAVPIYANGTGVPRALLVRMGHEDRAHEPSALAPVLRYYFDPQHLLEMPDGATLEGGDVVIGWSPSLQKWLYFIGKAERAPGRTNEAGRNFLRRLVEENGGLVREVPFDASAALHLSTCCGWAGPNSEGLCHVLCATEQLLDVSAFEEFGITPLWVPAGQEWGANVLRLPLDGAPLLVQSDYPALLELLEQNGYHEADIRVLPWMNVRALDGSLTCAVNVLQVPRPLEQ